MVGEQLSPQPQPQPQLSPDGYWWWNGSAWVPAAQTTPTAPKVYTASAPVIGFRSDVQMWASDLAAGRAPRVSPISGAEGTAEVKYKYRTSPQWSILLVIGGILIGVGWIPGVIIMLAVSKTASGPLYLTPAEKKSVRVKRAMPWALLLGTIVFFALSISLSSIQEAPTGLLFLVGVATFLGFVIAVLFVTPRIGPRAKVTELTPGQKVVRLQNVHPNFAAALGQVYAAYVGGSQ